MNKLHQRGIAVLEGAIALPVILSLLLGGFAVFEYIRLSEALLDLATKAEFKHASLKENGEALAEVLFKDLKELCSEIHESRCGLELVSVEASADPLTGQILEITKESKTHKGDTAIAGIASIESELLPAIRDNIGLPGIEFGKRDTPQFQGFRTFQVIRLSLVPSTGPLRFWYSLLGSPPVLSQIRAFPLRTES